MHQNKQNAYYNITPNRDSNARRTANVPRTRETRPSSARARITPRGSASTDTVRPDPPCPGGSQAALYVFSFSFVLMCAVGTECVISQVKRRHHHRLRGRRRHRWMIASCEERINDVLGRGFPRLPRHRRWSRLLCPGLDKGRGRYISIIGCLAKATVAGDGDGRRVNESGERKL